MKRLYLLIPLMLAFSTATAQDTVVPWLSPKYLINYTDSNHVGFWNLPLPIEGPGRGWNSNQYHISINGAAHFAPNVVIYGLAIPIGHLQFRSGESGHCIVNQLDVHLDYDARTWRSGVYPIQAMIVQLDNGVRRVVRSASWHYRSQPDISWKGVQDYYERNSYYVAEFYFDQPVQLADTFYACIALGGNQEPGTPLDTLNDYYLSATYRYVVRVITENEYQQFYFIHSPLNGCLDSVYSLCPAHLDCTDYLNAIPIIVPPDTDVVGCPPPSLRFIRALSGAPWFKYTLSTDEEVLEYQAIYSPLGCDDWDTIRPPSNPFKMGSNLDSTRYYKALFRTKHRHGCPIHDTVYWSPWSDTVLFYSGTTAPDTTNSIIPVVAETHAPFFTLTPNPTDGRVAVEVNSEELKDKSGEAIITVCNATGREVLKQKASTLNSQLSTLNLEALPAGTYFVTVTIGGQSGTRKLVVK